MCDVQQRFLLVHPSVGWTLAVSGGGGDRGAFLTGSFTLFFLSLPLTSRPTRSALVHARVFTGRLICC